MSFRQFNILIVIILSSLRCTSQTLSPCAVLQQIIHENDIINILELDNLSFEDTDIRVIDLTGEFIECSGKYKDKHYFVLNEMSPNLNTGVYHDIIISSFVVDSEKQVKVQLFLAGFKCRGDKQPNIAIDLSYKSNGAKIELLYLNKGQWSGGGPQVDYD